MAFADYQQLVNRMVPSTEGGFKLTPTHIDDAIGLAVLRYSADAPRELVLETGWLVPGFVGPLPAGWIDGSAIRDAEYPVGNHPRTLIDLGFYWDAGGSVLMSQVQLPAGATVRLTLSAPHRLIDAEDTIPLVHREAVASYAAHSLCRQLSTRFSADQQPSIGADSTNTESRARNFAARAKEYRSAYYAGIGKPDPLVATSGQTPGSGVQPAASVASWPGRRRFGLTRFGGGL